jgi:hypothetical protein
MTNPRITPMFFTTNGKARDPAAIAEVQRLKIEPFMLPGLHSLKLRTRQLAEELLGKLRLRSGYHSSAIFKVKSY